MSHTNNKEEKELWDASGHKLTPDEVKVIEQMQFKRNNKEEQSFKKAIEQGVMVDEHGFIYINRDELFKMMDEALHQELQKARHDWLQEEIVKLEGMKRKICGHGPSDSCDGACMHQHYDEEYNSALQTIIDRYQSELDQPNK